MKNAFTVKCPYCEAENDFTGDNWHDELIDDSQYHLIPCMSCGKEIEIEVQAIYTLSVIKPEYDEPLSDDILETGYDGDGI